MRLLQKATANDCTYVRIEPQDYTDLRSYIMRACNDLQDPTFFITSDIDNVLPSLLETGNGLVYGALDGGDLVAIQAADYHAADRFLLGSPIRKLLPKRYIESSWTMVASTHRRRGIARKLGNRVERDAHLETKCDCWIATIHPRNEASLNLYFGWGYYGVDLAQHFGVLRMILVKGIANPSDLFHADGEVELVAPGDSNAQSMLFRDGFICLGFGSGQERHFLRFAQVSL